jgi:uncharacterized delta-60 repeat protein
MLEDRCVPSAGQLDPTFGNGGIVTTAGLNIGGFGTALAVLLQPDGKEVAVGGWSARNGSGFALVRYTPSGTLDSTFGSGGVVTLNFGQLGTGAALQSDGKIVVVGSGGGGFALARFNTNGTLDNTFGKKGEVTTSFVSGIYTGAIARSVAIQADGKIVLAGYTGGNTYAAQQWAVARYNANGTLDTTFGSGGKVISAISPSGNVIYGLAIQPDGKLLVAGDYNAEYFAVGRYNSNGSFDTSFGNSGVVTTAVVTLPNSQGDLARKLTLQSDGKIVVVGGGSAVSVDGSTTYDFWDLARYNSDGSLDTSFGGTGCVTEPFGYSAYAVGIEPSDGKIVVAGEGFISGNGPAVGVARFDLDGSLDTTFNGTGVVFTQIDTSSHFSWASALAICPITGSANDGKIVIAGGGRSVGSAVVRYLPSEPEIASFTAGTNPVTAGSSETLTASGITDGNTGSTITQVTSYYIDSNNTQQLLGYGSQTSPGVWSYTFTVNLTSGSYTLLAQAEDSYGVFGDPASLTLTVQ